MFIEFSVNNEGELIASGCNEWHDLNNFIQVTFKPPADWQPHIEPYLLALCLDDSIYSDHAWHMPMAFKSPELYCAYLHPQPGNWELTIAGYEAGCEGSGLPVKRFPQWYKLKLE